MLVPARLLKIALVVAACVAAAPGCGARTALHAPDGGAGTESLVVVDFVERPLSTLDLLLEIDNSGSMRENQQNLMAQFGAFVRALTAPPDRDGDGRPDYPPVRDLHVGVISSDLGTPGSSVPGCANSDLGDDGLLNPIRNGQAMQDHLPWAPRRGDPAPPGFRPADCNRADQFPSFITFDSARTDVAAFEHDFRCNAGLYVNGCGLEQQLEAVWRALIWHDARERVGNTDPNAGFLREDALLAIVLFTDEEDGSVRDCRFARNAPCADAIDVFDPASSRWSSANQNLRMYLYQPGSEQDPTWPLERYVDPRDPSRGFLALKPGHPERVLFAAITGVPLQIPTRDDGGVARTDWDALLGAPDPADRENFRGRDARTAVDRMTVEGPISMRQANQDPRCRDRVVPACRREGTAYNPAMPQCTTAEQYYAWPARRIVEVARRFDESPLCNGAPCRTGVVASICGAAYTAATRAIIDRIGAQLPAARCVARPLRLVAEGAAGARRVACVLRESQPSGGACDAARGRTPVRDASGAAVTDGGRALCEVRQVATDAAGRPLATEPGWYYDTLPGSCPARVSFTPRGDPLIDARVRLVYDPGGVM